MKKLFLFAILAIAGIATASASTSFPLRIYCNGVLVYEDDEVIVADDADIEDIDEYIRNMEKIFCEE